MLLIPNAIFSEYVTHLNKREIAVGTFAEYKKWLRYYLDFCDKYSVPDAKSERVLNIREQLDDYEDLRTLREAKEEDCGVSIIGIGELKKKNRNSGDIIFESGGRDRDIKK